MNRSMRVSMRPFTVAAALVVMSGRLSAQHDMSQHDMARDSARGDSARGWTASLSGRAFVQYVDQSTKRGDRQLGVTDWQMLMASRRAGPGTVRLSAMTSIESAVIRGAGSPSLLQTGGTYRHARLHDRMHPHAVVMELAAAYDYPLARAVVLSVYAGAVGEPAIGPASFMHRASAANDPIAPIGHHWQDISHQSFGVVTLGVKAGPLRFEGSAFNPRETDERHLVVDYRGAKLDAYSGRVSWSVLPVRSTSRVTVSSWLGYFNSHDRLDPSARMHRYGGAVVADTRGLRGARWSSTLLYGMNLHHHGGDSHHLIHGAAGASPHHHASSVLAETNLGIGAGTVLFARAERVRKNGEELGFLGGDLMALYDVRSYVLGFTRQVAQLGALQVALGARGAVNFVPSTLLATYGTRRPSGFSVFAKLHANDGRAMNSTSR